MANKITKLSDLQKLKDVFDDIGVKHDVLENMHIIQYYGVFGSDLMMFHFDKDGKYKFND